MTTRRRHRTGCLAALTAAAVVAVMVPVAAGADAPDSRVVLVKLDPGADPADRGLVADALDAEASRGLPAGWRAYRLPQAVTLDQARAELADTGADLAVELDRPVVPLAVPDDPQFPSQWGMTTIGAPAAWDGPEGAPVVVAVTDTGVDIGHPDLAGRLWTNPGELANGVDDDGDGRVDDLHGWDVRVNDATLFDDPVGDAHGTHVAGTIAAVRSNGVGIAGVAANARIMSVKFMQTGLGGTNSGAIAALDYASRHGARIINASWGSPGYSQALCEAVQAATERGSVIVAAAGNNGADQAREVVYPAACPSPGVISVAATDATDTLAAFSNRGLTAVDIAAPGADITSLAPGGGTATLSGTSMAAPYVSGVAALVLGRRPDLSTAELKALLLGGGVPLPSLQGVTVSGRRVSATGSLALTATPDADREAPTAPEITGPADGALVRRLDVNWQESVDTGSGVARYRVVLDGREVRDVPATQVSTTLSDVADGPHTLRVIATDGVGNTAAGRAVGVRLDGTPPQPFAVTMPATTSASTVRVSWEPSEDANGIAGYRVDWGRAALNLPAGATAMPFALSVGTSLTVSVTAIDGAGNERTVTRTVSRLDPPPDPPSVAGPVTQRGNARRMCRRIRTRDARRSVRRCVRVASAAARPRRVVTGGRAGT